MSTRSHSSAAVSNLSYSVVFSSLSFCNSLFYSFLLYGMFLGRWVTASLQRASRSITELYSKLHFLCVEILPEQDYLSGYFRKLSRKCLVSEHYFERCLPHNFIGYVFMYDIVGNNTMFEVNNFHVLVIFENCYCPKCSPVNGTRLILIESFNMK